jgi:hypothetical protein
VEAAEGADAEAGVAWECGGTFIRERGSEQEMEDMLNNHIDEKNMQFSLLHSL